MVDLRGQRILIVGLGASGASSLHHLARHGALLTVTDSRAAPARAETRRPP